MAPARPERALASSYKFAFRGSVAYAYTKLTSISKKFALQVKQHEKSLIIAQIINALDVIRDWINGRFTQLITAVKRGAANGEDNV
jgi:hypothetical protein